MALVDGRRIGSILVMLAATAMLLAVSGCAVSRSPMAILTDLESDSDSAASGQPASPETSASMQTEINTERNVKAATGKPGSLTANSPVGLAVFELAQRLGTSSESITVMRIEEELVLPSDATICSIPLSDGVEGNDGEVVEISELVLAASGREYTFRLKGWEVALCWPESAVSDLPTTPELEQVAVPVAMAMRELASAASIPASQIRVHSVEAVEWPDSSLGCPEEGMMYAQVLTPGYRIILEVGDSKSEFHSDLERVVLCQGSPTD